MGEQTVVGLGRAECVWQISCISRIWSVCRHHRAICVVRLLHSCDDVMFSVFLFVGNDGMKQRQTKISTILRFWFKERFD